MKWPAFPFFFLNAGLFTNFLEKFLLILFEKIFTPSGKNLFKFHPMGWQYVYQSESYTFIYFLSKSLAFMFVHFQNYTVMLFKWSFSRVKRKFQAPWEEMPVTRGRSPRVIGISSRGAWNFLFTRENILWITLLYNFGNEQT